MSIDGSFIPGILTETSISGSIIGHSESAISNLPSVQTSNVITNNGYWDTYGIWHPYYSPPVTTHIYNNSPNVTYNIQIREVQNGWIAVKDGKEYIISEPEEILKLFKKNK